MRITRTYVRIQIHGDQNMTFRIFNAKVISRLASQLGEDSRLESIHATLVPENEQTEG